MTEERSDRVVPDSDAAVAPGAGRADGADGGVEALRAELEQVRQQQLRAVADYQNLQRRAQEERAEFGRFQLTALVVNFLPVLDDLERALESTHDDIRDHPWVEGIRLVLQKFRGVLEAAGIQEIHALNQPFTPDHHEAVGTAPGPEGTVVRVLQRGFMLNDRVLRPAMVMVGGGEEAAEPTAAEPSA